MLIGGTFFQQKLTLNRMAVQVFIISFTIIINSMHLACVKATLVAFAT